MGREIIEDVLAEGVEELVALQVHSGVGKFELNGFHWCQPVTVSRSERTDPYRSDHSHPIASWIA